ncbi:hypothetical protein JQX13_00110 [Archangium violaceum]|nr:hypothetical protein [Archangium violaceum]QRK08635.1 hypothetical protein JQX13_00110 [Archangium violaceum]
MRRRNAYVGEVVAGVGAIYFEVSLFVELASGPASSYPHQFTKLGG